MPCGAPWACTVDRWQTCKIVNEYSKYICEIKFGGVQMLGTRKCNFQSALPKFNQAILVQRL